MSASTWLLLAILVCSFLLKLNHLGHSNVRNWDEVFHAIVARNFLKHPLTPTLNDPQFIPAKLGDWYNGGIWLHKPPLAMWQIAISYAIFGVNTFALRLPSVMLSTGAVWLTFLIARRLIDEPAALVAAALQAFAPAIVMLVQGYSFSDHVDVSLLFYAELAIYFLVRSIENGGNLDAVLSGVAQGLALLSKAYPALIVMGLAIVAWILFRARIADPATWRFRGRHLLVFLLTTILTILPWTLWAWVHWPREFGYENLQQIRHASQDVEQWGAPWDRLVFDYAIRVFHVYYPLALATVPIAIMRGKERRPAMAHYLLDAGHFHPVFAGQNQDARCDSSRLAGSVDAHRLAGLTGSPRRLVGAGGLDQCRRNGALLHSHGWHSLYRLRISRGARVWRDHASTSVGRGRDNPGAGRRGDH